MVWQQGYQLKNGEYIIESVLGSGGFGDTYKAIKKSENGNKIVAIKTLSDRIQMRPDFQEHQERFVQEAFNLLKCSHPNIVRIERVFQEKDFEVDLWCMEMEYIQGYDLHDYIKRNGILSQEIALAYINQVGEALTYVHETGFLHRDVKPANILICDNGTKAILIDFGLAREFIQDFTKTHSLASTPGYAPIEQYKERDKRGAYTDVYALAATLYFSLTGEVPLPSIYRNQGIPLITPKEHNPKISDKINKAILVGMEVLPEYRPQTMKEWLKLLKFKSTTIEVNTETEVQSLFLETEADIDYLQLNDLLAQQQWKKADEETYQLMLSIAKRENQGWFDVSSIDNFPSLDLRTIDRLWVHYSKGRFGFSTQKRIYQTLGGTKVYKEKIWNNFGDKVGWKVKKKWIYYKDAAFSGNAPEGHLPLLYHREFAMSVSVLENWGVFWLTAWRDL